MSAQQAPPARRRSFSVFSRSTIPRPRSSARSAISRPATKSSTRARGWMSGPRATRPGSAIDIVGEDGSDTSARRCFAPRSITSATCGQPASPDGGALTPDNYVFEERGAQPDGLASLAVKPRRKGILLVDGSIFLNPDDGELVRMEGRLVQDAVFLDAPRRNRPLVSANRRFPDADRARNGRQRSHRRRVDLPHDLRIREHQRPASRAVRSPESLARATLR